VSDVWCSAAVLALRRGKEVRKEGGREGVTYLYLIMAGRLRERPQAMTRTS